MVDHIVSSSSTSFVSVVGVAPQSRVHHTQLAGVLSSEATNTALLYSGSESVHSAASMEDETSVEVKSALNATLRTSDLVVSLTPFKTEPNGTCPQFRKVAPRLTGAGRSLRRRVVSTQFADEASASSSSSSSAGPVDTCVTLSSVSDSASASSSSSSSCESSAREDSIMGDEDRAHVKPESAVVENVSGNHANGHVVEQEADGATVGANTTTTVIAPAELSQQQETIVDAKRTASGKIIKLKLQRKSGSLVAAPPVGAVANGHVPYGAAANAPVVGNGAGVGASHAPSVHRSPRPRMDVVPNSRKSSRIKTPKSDRSSLGRRVQGSPGSVPENDTKSLSIDVSSSALPPPPRRSRSGSRTPRRSPSGSPTAVPASPRYGDMCSSPRTPGGRSRRNSSSELHSFVLTGTSNTRFDASHWEQRASIATPTVRVVGRAELLRRAAQERQAGVVPEDLQDETYFLRHRDAFQQERKHTEEVLATLKKKKRCPKTPKDTTPSGVPPSPLCVGLAASNADRTTDDTGSDHDARMDEAEPEAKKMPDMSDEIFQPIGLARADPFNYERAKKRKRKSAFDIPQELVRYVADEPRFLQAGGRDGGSIPADVDSKLDSEAESPLKRSKKLEADDTAASYHADAIDASAGEFFPSRVVPVSAVATDGDPAGSSGFSNYAALRLRQLTLQKKLHMLKARASKSTTADAAETDTK